MSQTRPLRWHPSVIALRDALSPDQEAYLVGGAVRDAYLHRLLHDIDLATPGDGCPLARRIADHFNGAFYVLDRERGVGRALIPWEDHQLTVDVAQFRGPDLDTDLYHRDFTLNAMAVRLMGDLQTVYDPLGGLDDLEQKRLRQCGPQSIATDPVRALRAIRASTRFGLLIEPETRRQIKTHAAALQNVSAERLRDEFLTILAGQRPAAAIDAMLHLGLLEQIVPEVNAMQGVTQSVPHQFDLWAHTRHTINWLNTILRIVQGQANDNTTANVQTGLIVFSMGHLRDKLAAHMTQDWPNQRPHHALLLLAALLHDAGKPATREESANGRVRFLRHEQVGAEIAETRGQALKLSNDETKRLTMIVRNHMRPHWLVQAPDLTARAVYRFWRDTGAAGVDACLLALADTLATYGTHLETPFWLNYVDTIRELLSRYFEQGNSIKPPQIVTGGQLIKHLKLTPGPQIGVLLEEIREAQVEGLISTREEALDWVQRRLEKT